MPLIDLSEKVRPRDVLETLEQEFTGLTEQLDPRRRILEELSSLATEIGEAEAQLVSARKQVFLLMHEKLRRTELAGSDEFVAFVEAELERLEGGGAKKGAK